MLIADVDLTDPLLILTARTVVIAEDCVKLAILTAYESDVVGSFANLLARDDDVGLHRCCYALGVAFAVCCAVVTLIANERHWVL